MLKLPHGDKHEETVPPAQHRLLIDTNKILVWAFVLILPCLKKSSRGTYWVDNGYRKGPDLPEKDFSNLSSVSQLFQESSQIDIFV